jgi:hypothetical protein
MVSQFHGITVGLVLLLSIYSILKFAFFFVVTYPKRRAALDKAYAGRAYSGAMGDRVLLALTVVVAVLALLDRAVPIAFLGGMFVGATLIQLFFHAFHEPVALDREAPEPRSPLKRMSYAIQDKPARAWKEMTTMAAIIAVAIGIYFLGA